MAVTDHRLPTPWDPVIPSFETLEAEHAAAEAQRIYETEFKPLALQLAAIARRIDACGGGEPIPRYDADNAADVLAEMAGEDV